MNMFKKMKINMQWLVTSQPTIKSFTPHISAEQLSTAVSKPYADSLSLLFPWENCFFQLLLTSHTGQKLTDFTLVTFIIK